MTATLDDRWEIAQVAARLVKVFPAPGGSVVVSG